MEYRGLIDGGCSTDGLSLADFDAASTVDAIV